MQRRCRHDPAAFRRFIRLSERSEQPFDELMQPWQRADFRALDPAWLRLAGRDVTSTVRRAWIERPRGHAKTSDMAVQLAWILLFAEHAVSGLAAAADRDQAALIRDALLRLALANPELARPLSFTRHTVVNRGTGSRLDVISSDVASSWGVLPGFVICDELCHWEKPEMWQSLISSAAKDPGCVLAVLTNAGRGRGWQWDLREAARDNAAGTDPTWHFSSLDGVHAPWLSERDIDEQRLLLPPPVFERLWLNRWQHSDGEFVTLAEAEACRDESLSYQHRGEHGRRYVAAVDYAEKHDLCAAIVVHLADHTDRTDRAGEVRIVVDRLDVVVPSPGDPVPVAWVERWAEEVAEKFPGVLIVFDEHQMVGTIQRLQASADVRRFDFAAGRGNHRLAVALRQLITHRELAWYPGCGQRPDTADRDDLETELASLLLKQSPAGRVRIDHRRDGRHHDDRSFALGAACLYALETDAAADWLHITEPHWSGGFAL
jgi:hypothetical protein